MAKEAGERRGFERADVLADVFAFVVSLREVSTEFPSRPPKIPRYLLMVGLPLAQFDAFGEAYRAGISLVHLDVRTLTYCQLVGFPLKRLRVKTFGRADFATNVCLAA